MAAIEFDAIYCSPDNVCRGRVDGLLVPAGSTMSAPSAGNAGVAQPGAGGTTASAAAAEAAGAAW